MSIFNPFVISSAFLCLCLTVFINSSISPSIFSPFESCIRLPDFLSHLQSPVRLNHGSPHVPSWSSWFHPQGSIDLAYQPEKQRNRLYNLGRTGPWVEMLDHVLPRGNGIGPPEGCSVDQVHMVDFPCYSGSISLLSKGLMFLTLRMTLQYTCLCWNPPFFELVVYAEIV